MAQDVSATKLAPIEETPANLAREYVAAPNSSASIRPAIFPAHSETVEHLPIETIRLMMFDPVIESNFNLLRELVLADGVQLVPHLIDEGDDRAESPANNQAVEIREFCARVIEEYLETPLREALEGLLEGIPYGCKIAEQTFELVTEGQDVNKLVTRSIKLKEHRALSFVVDAFWNILGLKPSYRIPTADNQSAEPPTLPRSKFIIFSYNKRDEDPRGRSGWRSILSVWKFKQEFWPILKRFMKQCAIPGLIGKVSANSKPEVKRDSEGAIILGSDGRPVTLNPTDVMLLALANYENSTAIAVAAGSEVDQIKVDSEGTLFRAVLDILDKQITQGQLRSTRATTEAEHGSKADSKTSLDLLSTFVWYLKGRLIETFRNDALKPLVLFNFGPEAVRMTPDVMMGDADRYDWAKDATAMAALAVHLTDSQWDALCQASGIEPPLPDEERPARGQIPASDDPNAPGQGKPGDPQKTTQDGPKQAKERAYIEIAARDVFTRRNVTVRLPRRTQARAA